MALNLVVATIAAPSATLRDGQTLALFLLARTYLGAFRGGGSLLGLSR